MKRLLCLLFCIISLYANSQNQLITQTVYYYPSLFWDISKYPKIQDLIVACQNNTAKSKLIQKGETYEIIGMPENSKMWMLYVKARKLKDNKEGWISSKYIQHREGLLPFFPDFRKQYISNIKERRVEPKMNKSEVYVCTNIYIPDDTEEGPNLYDLNKRYEQWGVSPDIMLFYENELCVSQVESNKFYILPKLKFEIESVDVDKNSITDKVINGNSYSDNLLEISWSANEMSVSFDLKNKTMSSMKLLWDDMSFANNKSHRVIHNGVRIIDKDKEQANTVVSPNSKYSDFLMPCNNISWSEEMKQWYNIAIYKGQVFSDKDIKGIEELKSQKFSVLFTIKHKDEIYEYNFHLKVANVDFYLVDGKFSQRHVL